MIQKLTQKLRMMFNQISKHSVAQLSGHVKLIITTNTDLICNKFVNAMEKKKVFQMILEQ
jgi:hypothetical protein